MEDGVKEDSAQSKEPKFPGKAGWIKRAPSRLLASYKDFYIQVERTEIVVYKSEEQKSVLERVDLENYDKCHELKSAFTRKHRLILTRSTKSGKKIHDWKFQTQSAEEKEAWIKALSDGISRAKNKIFDEVKIDESCNLEHVTRTRPKGNRNRRPPTRIHMKEVGDVADGTLRLDLDLEDGVMTNGIPPTTVDGANKLAVPSSIPSEASKKEEELSGEKEAESEPAATPQKKVIKPPMPPTKVATPVPETIPEKPEKPEKEPTEDDDTVKELKPPTTPSKESKPRASPEAPPEAPPEAKEENKAEMVKKAPPPPTPLKKPTSGSVADLVEASKSMPDPHPPTPPSKEKKPLCNPVAEPKEEVQRTPDEKEEMKGDGGNVNRPVAKEEVAPSVSNGGPCPEEDVSGTQLEASDKEPKKPDSLVPEPAAPLKKSQSPAVSPKKPTPQPRKPNTQKLDNNKSGTDEEEDAPSQLQTPSDATVQQGEASPKKESTTVVTLLNDSTLSLSPLITHLPVEKKKKVEEKSVDSGQHSGADSDASLNEDAVTAFTAEDGRSNAGLDTLDATEDDIHKEISLDLDLPTGHDSETSAALAQSAKAKSASHGDLLSDSSISVQELKPAAADTGSNRVTNDDLTKPETEPTLEMEKTREQEDSLKEETPEDVQAKAKERLEKAEQVFKKVSELKLENKSSIRKSW